MEQEIKLGVIGPLWIRQTMMHCMEMFPSIHAIYRLSDNLHDAFTFTEELAEEVDGFLYSGRIPYKVARAALPEEKPAFYIPLKGSGLYQSLYRLKAMENFKHISFDGIHANYIERARTALGETFSWDLYPSQSLLDEMDKIIAFHEKSYKKNPDAVAITSLKIVSEALKEKGIPTRWLIPSEDDIIVILERLLLAMQQRIDSEKQIAIGRIKVESHSKFALQHANQQQIQKRNEEIYRLLMSGTKEMEAFLTRSSDTEYFFVTSKGAFERITEGYKCLPMLTEVHQKFSIRLSAGVGFGSNATDAGRHSAIALAQALEDKETSCYIVREDRSVIGPVDLIAPLKYAISITDDEKLKKVQDVKMNAVHLEKIMAGLKRANITSFSAYDLSLELGITPRSAHRILLEWLDARLVQIVGTEKLSSKGRPRQVYAFMEEE